MIKFFHHSHKTLPLLGGEQKGVGNTNQNQKDY